MEDSKVKGLVSVYLDLDLKKWLEEQATVDGRSLSNFIERILIKEKESKV